MSINPEQEEVLKKKLLSEYSIIETKIKHRLQLSSRQYLNELAEKITDMSADTLIEHLSLCESYSLNLYKQQIQSIDAALQGMELGIYGVCADCESELKVNQLFENPMIQRCNECQIKYQNQHTRYIKL